MANETKIIELEGKGRWFHVLQTNKYGKWSIEFFPNPESLEILRGLQAEGMKNVLKKDEDGYFIRFSREPSKKIKGVTVEFAPPIVMDKDGQKISGNKTFGNGSDVILALEVYSHATPSGGRAKAARMKGVKFINEVPYTNEQAFGEDAPIADSLAAAQPQDEYWN